METSNQAPKFADVSINLARIDRSYHYAIPEELQGRLKPGCLVICAVWQTNRARCSVSVDRPAGST